MRHFCSALSVILLGFAVAGCNERHRYQPLGYEVKMQAVPRSSA